MPCRPAPTSRRRAWPAPAGFRRAFRHLLPGAVPAIVVTASLDVGNLVLTLAGLSFLGLGAPAPAPELGAMAARGLQYLLQEWWVPVMPALVMFLLTHGVEPVRRRAQRRHERQVTTSGGRA